MWSPFDAGGACSLAKHEAVVKERDQLRADLDAARAQVEALKHEMSHNAVMLALKAAIEEAEQRRVDLDDARNQLEAHNEDLREMRAQLDAAKKLLERSMKLLEEALNRRCYPDHSWGDRAEDLTNEYAFLAQKRGG
jgi:chromosome segregation ATPase